MSVLTEVEMKRQYNRLLERANKADKFFESCSDKEFEKWYPDYLEVSRALSKIIWWFRDNSNPMKNEEILRGFNDV